MPQGSSPKRESPAPEPSQQDSSPQFESEGRKPGEEEVADPAGNQQRADVNQARPPRSGTGHRRRNTARRNRLS